MLRYVFQIGIFYRILHCKHPQWMTWRDSLSKESTQKSQMDPMWSWGYCLTTTKTGAMIWKTKPKLNEWTHIGAEIVRKVVVLISMTTWASKSSHYLLFFRVTELRQNWPGTLQNRSLKPIQNQIWESSSPIYSTIILAVTNPPRRPTHLALHDFNTHDHEKWTHWFPCMYSTA